MSKVTNFIKDFDVKKWFWWGFLILFFIYYFLYLLFSDDYVSFKDIFSSDTLISPLAQIIKSMDFIGYVFGYLAIMIGLWITKKVEEKNDIKQSEIKSTIKELNTTIENLTDLSRKILDTLPKIFDEITTILDKANLEKCNKFYYMNGPVVFGQIHSFNRRFLMQFSSKNEVTNGTIEEINSKIDRIRSCTEVAALNVNDFKFLVKKTTALNEKFIAPYIEVENSDEDKRDKKGLIFHSDNKVSEIEDESLEEKIKQKFIELNESRLSSIRNRRSEYYTNKGKSSEVEKDIVEIDDDLPMFVLYLLEYFENHEVKYHSLAIFYEDYKGMERTLVGISSSNKQFYNAFETIFKTELEKHND